MLMRDCSCRVPLRTTADGMGTGDTAGGKGSARCDVACSGVLFGSSPRFTRGIGSASDVAASVLIGLTVGGLRSSLGPATLDLARTGGAVVSTSNLADCFMSGSDH